MRRRDFVALAGGLVVSWPISARAQREMPVVGFLHSASPQRFVALVDEIRQGLRETGYSEDRNVRIEYRWAEDHYDQLPALAAELVHRQVAVIVANNVAALAAKAATATIPIVFLTGNDPVKSHLVSGLAHPNGNITGVSFFEARLEAKKLEILHELIPRGAVIGVLMNPNNPDVGAQSNELLTAAQSLERQVKILQAGSEGEFAAAFDFLAQQGVKALVVAGDPLFNGRQRALIELAARHSIAAIFSDRQSVNDGGLISYGNDRRPAYRQVGIYAGRILKGAKPADLPVMQPMRIELTVNLRTAKTLGLDVPPALLDRADAVIE